MKISKISFIFLVSGILLQSNIFASTCRDLKFSFNNQDNSPVYLKTNGGQFPSSLAPHSISNQGKADKDKSQLWIGGLSIPNDMNSVEFEIDISYDACSSNQIGSLAVRTMKYNTPVTAHYDEATGTVIVDIP